MTSKYLKIQKKKISDFQILSIILRWISSRISSWISTAILLNSFAVTHLILASFSLIYQRFSVSSEIIIPLRKISDISPEISYYNSRKLSQESFQEKPVEKSLQELRVQLCTKEIQKRSIHNLGEIFGRYAWKGSGTINKTIKNKYSKWSPKKKVPRKNNTERFI